MEIRDESGLVIRTPVEIDFGSPVQSFIFPGFTRLKTWLSRSTAGSVRIHLKFEEAFYIFCELTHDDRDSGLFKNLYVENIVRLKEGTKVDWRKPGEAVNKKDLRPVPEEMNGYFLRQSSSGNFDYKSLTDDFIRYVCDRTSLKVLSNENYHLYSSFGEVEEEFLASCYALASVEKSERALELATIVDRELQQAVAGLKHEAKADRVETAEITETRIVDFEFSCKRLINKAVSLHVLEPDHTGDYTSRAVNYTDTLKQESEKTAVDLESYSQEFIRFSDDLIERFAELELEVNDKAEAIESVEIPPSSSMLELLKVEKVWLPFWNIRYEEKGDQGEVTLIAY